MSRSQQIGKVIQGDAVVTQATWLPSLNFIKKDTNLEIVSNPEQFVFGSELVLDDTIYSRTNQIVNPQQVVDNPLNKYLEFEFITANITNTDSMFITIPVTWQITRKEIQAAYVGMPIRNARQCARSLSGYKRMQTVERGNNSAYIIKDNNTAGPTLSAVDEAILNNYSVKEQVISSFNEADFVAACQYQLHLIKTCEIMMGNNYITLGNYSMIDLSSIKALNTLVQQDSKFQTLHGIYNNESGYSPSNNHDYVINDKHLKCFYQNLTASGYDIQRAQQVFGLDDNYAIMIPITIPLKMLNSFFQKDRYLPAGLPIKIKLSCYEISRVILMDPGLKTAVGLPLIDNEVVRWAISVTANNLNQAELRYQSLLLRQPIEDTINRKWLENPYLYNYITATKQSQMTDGTSTTYRFNIAVNQEVPLQLIIYAESNQTNSMTNMFPYDRSRVLQWGFFDEDYEIQVNNQGIPDTDTRMTFMYEYIDTDNPLPMILKSYDFIINGVRRKQNIRVDSIVLASLKNGVDILEDMITYNSFNAKNLKNTNSIQNRNYGIGHYFHLTIDPGNFVTEDYRSTSVGAQTATLELELYTKGILPYSAISNQLNYKISPGYTARNGYITMSYDPLKSGQKITILNILPEQIRLDMNRNVTKIKFPAVASSNDASMQMSNIINAN